MLSRNGIFSFAQSGLRLSTWSHVSPSPLSLTSLPPLSLGAFSPMPGSRFFSSPRYSSIETIYSLEVRYMMKALSDVFNVLDMPKTIIPEDEAGAGAKDPTRAKLTQLLLAHDKDFDPLKNKIARPPASVEMVVGYLEKIFNMLNATSQLKKEDLPAIKSELIALQGQKSDYELIQAGRTRNPLIAIDLADMIKEFNDRSFFPIHWSVNPDQFSYCHLQQHHLKLLGAEIDADGKISAFTNKINSFESYKAHLLEIKELMKKVKTVKYVEAGDQTFVRFHLTANNVASVDHNQGNTVSLKPCK
jgi:hypothetical protein